MALAPLGHAKRWLKIVGGFALLAAGDRDAGATGPGLVTIALGLALLSVEFVWARRRCSIASSEKRPPFAT